MPDITMCVSRICPLRLSCYRNFESGTKPNSYRQSVTDFTNSCNDTESIPPKTSYYWPINPINQGDRHHD